MRFTIRTLIWTFVLLALIMTGVAAMIPKSIDVEFSVVEEGPLRVSVEEDGKTRVQEKYIVSAPVAGRLTRIELRAGDEITGDETLIAVILPSDPAMLDARARAEATARVQAAEAALQRAESATEQAKIDHELKTANFERAERMLPTRAISQTEYDVANSEYLASVQTIKTAKFESEIAKFELDMARAAANQFADEDDAQSPVKAFEVRAPISGKVLRVFQESSTVLSVGTPLIELGDPKKLELEIDVLSTDAVRIKPGAELTVEHWGGDSPLVGHVRVIEPAAFTKVSSLGVEEQRVNIIADFDEAPERIASLGDGYRIEARVTIDELPNALLVPNSALFRHQRQWHVMKIVSDRAMMQAVEIGLQNEIHTQIVKGLRQGEKIIVYPSDEISSGTKVRVVNGK